MKKNFRMNVVDFSPEYSKLSINFVKCPLILNLHNGLFQKMLKRVEFGLLIFINFLKLFIICSLFLFMIKKILIF